MQSYLAVRKQLITKILDTEDGPALEIPEEFMLALGLKIGDVLKVEVLNIDGVTQAVLSPKAIE